MTFRKSKTGAHSLALQEKKATATAAEDRAYEQVVTLRDPIEAREFTVSHTRKFERNLPGTHNHSQVVKHLQQELQLPGTPKYLECFDISYTSGSFYVASMVVFKNGKPNRKNYRRFKFKSFISNDDFRAMEEVVGRHCRRLLQHTRNEAHHFANNFNAELHNKGLKESILDDFPGIGTKRKLLQHFGSI